MSRFYFDFCDGTCSSRDTDGLELDSIQAARVEAVQGLIEIIRGRRFKEDAAELMLVVRDAAGLTALTAKLSLLVDYPVQPLVANRL